MDIIYGRVTEIQVNILAAPDGDLILAETIPPQVLFSPENEYLYHGGMILRC
jgi:hypothetical protein